MPEEFHEPDGGQQSFPNSSELVAYRLGRVEKTVDQINRHSIERDDKILEKLEAIGSIAAKVAHVEWEVESLKGSRTRLYQIIGGMASAIFLIVLQLIFRLI